PFLAEPVAVIAIGGPVVLEDVVRGARPKTIDPVVPATGHRLHGRDRSAEQAAGYVRGVRGNRRGAPIGPGVQRPAPTPIAASDAHESILTHPGRSGDGCGSPGDRLKPSSVAALRRVKVAGASGGVRGSGLVLFADDNGSNMSDHALG